MNPAFSRFSTIITVSGFLVLFACGAEPMLESKSAAVPVGIDMTGYWLVRAQNGGAGVPEFSGVEQPLILRPKSQQEQRSRQRRSSGGAAQVFLEFGDSLKISQTNYGLFISYDRSIVEEYTFGENRVVSIGPIEARRVSGWEADTFVVETMDRSGRTLFESWHLLEDATVLVREVRISEGNKESFSHTQIFDRQ